MQILAGLRSNKLFLLIPLALLLFFIFWGVDQVSQKSEAVLLVEKYLQALADHDGNLISNLSCGTWENQALMEVDSFQLVKVSLRDVRCAVVGEEANGILVNCSGSIETTYNNEQSSIDLGQQNYLVNRENGDLFVCGYQ